MNRPSEPFNAEERDLAQRLARLGGPREPAPALDAMILSAARAAVSQPADASAASATTPVEAPDDPKITPLRPRKATPRWPLGMGLAASLVLAAGIGWRLQGDGEGSSAESAMAPTAEMEDAVQAVILEPALQRAPPAPPPPLADASEDAVSRRTAAPQEAMAKAIAPPASEPEFVADTPMADADASPQVMTAPATSAGATANSLEGDSLDSVTVTGSRVSQERAVGAAEYTRTPLNERREQASDKAASAPAAGSRQLPAAPAPAPARARGLVEGKTDAEEQRKRDAYRFDDRPPVTADSPEFRQAWLQRIRDHLAKGEQDAARDSLQEFRRRYPDIELPEDLRKLAATLPAP